MMWRDEGYLISKNNFDENSIIAECFTLNHGKFSGVVYGGSSRKSKKIFQLGNKLLLNYKSKSENKIGYYTIELIKPITPKFFDDKKRSICILSAASLLKILLPERQNNKKIYDLLEGLLSQINLDNWIKYYIYWEIALVNALGFEINLNLDGKKINTIEVNDKTFPIPKVLNENNISRVTKNEIKQALIFNKTLIMENFIIPNKLKFPLSRNILEKYYS